MVILAITNLLRIIATTMVMKTMVITLMINIHPMAITVKIELGLTREDKITVIILTMGESRIATITIFTGTIIMGETRGVDSKTRALGSIV